MPIIKEEFKPQWYKDQLTQNIELVYLPKISVFLKIEGVLYPFKIEAHVDSGATRNLFPSDPLDDLGIKLDNGKKVTHHGIGGIDVVSFAHEVEILIGGYTIKTEIDFSNKHKAPLLGVEKFFKHFDYVAFNMRLFQTELSYNLKKAH